MSSSKESDVMSLEQDETGDPSPQSIQYEELLEVVVRAVEKLKIDWPDERQEDHLESKLNEHFLCHASVFLSSLISMLTWQDFTFQPQRLHVL